MSSLTELRERVERATGPDLELDYQIGRALADVPFPTPDREYYPPITASIDAALALVERKLPEWQGVYLVSEWTGYRRPGNGIEYRATLRRGIHSYIEATGKGAALALAILSALLRALESQEQSGG